MVTELLRSSFFLFYREDMVKSYKDKKGYRRWKDSNKLVHRSVAEKKIGGRIGRGRVVHHIDGNKQNNQPSNLRVMSRSDHSSLHAKKRRWFW